MNFQKSLAERAKSRSKKNRIFSAISVVLILVMLLVIVMNAFVYFNVEVDGVSMYPTLNHGDVVKANKYRSPTYGDIVVIRKNDGEEAYNVVKRVIAMEGDRIEIKDGSVFLNGELLVEKYIKDDPSTEFIDESKTYGGVDTVIPKGKFFYLGDNRVNSIDSRNDGLADVKQISGVVEEWTIATRGIRNFLFDLFYR